MERVIDDYKAKNFELNIESGLFAMNHGLDFSGFLDTRQALGAENLMSIIKDLDEAGLNDWVIYGWYGNQRFGEDFSGEMKDGTSFINESYFTNEMKMDNLWMNMPCLKIATGFPDGGRPPKVYVSMSLAPYEREEIMDGVEFTNVAISNEDGFPFPGSGASIVVKNERYRRQVNEEYSVPHVLTFRMPQTFCVRMRYPDRSVKDSWVFILPQDVDEMHKRLSEMICKEREERYDE